MRAWSTNEERVNGVDWRSRSRSRESLARSDGVAFSDDATFEGSCSRRKCGGLRAWRERSERSPVRDVEDTVLVLTCEHNSGVVTCRNIAGTEVAAHRVPVGQEAYGPWLGPLVFKSLKPIAGKLWLVTAGSEIVWKQPECSESEMETRNAGGKRARRFTGRQRFEEGHDNRDACNFEEYYRPKYRFHTHEERWNLGHDDRDGWTYHDHAPSVRPWTDPRGFASV